MPATAVDRRRRAGLEQGPEAADLPAQLATGALVLKTAKGPVAVAAADIYF